VRGGVQNPGSDNQGRTLPEGVDPEAENFEVWGYQLIVDCFGCAFDICCDLDRGYEFLDQVCHFLKMTKQTQPYVFKTCDKMFPGRPGYSGWLPIIESGIQIHTSAHNRFISIDLYSCKPFDCDKTEEFVQNWFQPEKIETQFIFRGRNLKGSTADDTTFVSRRS
jgi:S-adenosylmethionine decarboxylase